MNKKQLFLIQDSPTVSNADILREEQIMSLGIPILEEAYKAGRKGGCVFRTALQEANTINQNKRIYQFEAINNALKEESTKINNGCFLGEADHPSSSDPQRFQTVSVKDSCFRILKTEWEGNKLYGICETLCNSLGKDMRALIVENGMKLGFSLRAMGKTQRNPMTGITEVQHPMKMFCYDWVSNPSHSNAVMDRIISESQLIEMATTSNQKEILMESASYELEALVESYGYGLENLLNTDNVAVDGRNNLLIMNCNDTVVKTFIEESTVNKFFSAASKFL